MQKSPDNPLGTMGWNNGTLVTNLTNLALVNFAGHVYG